jgi:glycerophosphoryl diester phosphodiesterase
LSERFRPGAAYLAGAPLLIAHRGGAGLAPENTLLAFRRALDWWGADVLELDVRCTRDGEAVVFHDDTLERTTSGSGRVAEHTLAEIRALDAGFHFSADGATTPFRGAGAVVPTLEEVLRACPDARINIEVKDPAAAPAVAESVRRTGSARRILVAAPKRAYRAGLDGEWPVSASEEEIRTMYVLHRLRFGRLHTPAVDALQLPELHEGRRILTPGLIREAHAKNIAVHVWTVDEEPDMRRLLDWGVDGIVTDRPDRLARVLHVLRGRPLPPGPPAEAGAGVPGPLDSGS